MLNQKSNPPRKSIADVARRLGVSVATVSMALNDKGRISTKTRGRVLAACQKLHYHPHPGARFFPSLRSLPNTRVPTNTFAFTPVLAPGSAATYLAFLPGIAAPARREGKAILYQPFEKGSAMDFKLTGQFRVDGRILVGLVDDSVLDVFKAENIPLLVLGDHSCQRPVWNVNSDNAAAAQMAVDRLWSRGHRRIGLFCEPRPSGYQEEFTRGMQAALQKRGADLSDERTLANRPEDLERLRALLGRKDRPTAFVAVTNTSAESLLFHAKEAGLTMFKDLEIIVFGLLPAISKMSILPSPAYIDQGCREMGIRAMDILIHLAEKGAFATPCRTLVQPILVTPGTD